MDLLLLGTGMGIVGGLIPSPLHLIALTQVALDRWWRAIVVLIGPPLVIDGGLLLVTFFFYQFVPHGISHYLAYVGGTALVGFGAYSLLEMRRKSQSEMAQNATLSYATVTVAALAELGAPGTWIYWLTVAGPIIAEGRHKGYMTIVPFFVGSLVGFYGAAVFSTWLLAWGASLHRHFRKHLFLVANLLLVVLGLSYLLRAYFRL